MGPLPNVQLRGESLCNSLPLFSSGQYSRHVCAKGFWNDSLIAFWSQLDCCLRTYFTACSPLPWGGKTDENDLWGTQFDLMGMSESLSAFLDSLPTLILHAVEGSPYPLSLVFWLRLFPRLHQGRGTPPTGSPGDLGPWGHFSTPRGIQMEMRPLLLTLKRQLLHHGKEHSFNI